MIRNLKALGLALVAIFAMGAITASAASAQTPGKITSTGPVTLVADELAGHTNALTYPGLNVVLECPGHIVTGHKTLTTAETEAGKKHELIPSGSSTATLTPHYTGCHAVETPSGTTHRVTVTMNGCDYDLRIGETTGVGEDTYGVEADLVCPAGKVVDIEVYPFAGSELGGVVCTFTVPAQNGLKGPHLTGDTTKPHDLTLTGTFTGIKVTKQNLGGCPEGAAESNAAELHVGYTVTGKNAAGEATEITLSH